MKLPEHFEWEKPDSVLEKLGESEYSAIYCPDEEIYEKVTGIAVLVNVSCVYHQWGKDASVTPANCTTDGKIGYKCEICGEIKTEILNKGHQPEVRNQKEASNTENGYTGDTYCKVCGILLEQGQVIPKLKESDDNQQNGGGTDTPPTEQTPSAGSTETPSTEVTDIPAIEQTVMVGDVVKAIDGDKNASYQVTSLGRVNTVAFTGTTSKKIVIPDTVTDADGNVYKVTSMKAKAFTSANKKSATSVTIGNNVKKIESSQFAGFIKLKTVTMGNGVTTIGSSAFCGDKKLTTVKFGRKVSSIGADAFKNTGLKKAAIPNSTKAIGSRAFAECKSLTSVSMGLGVQTIGKMAFHGDKKLKSIKINSKKLKTVGVNAFKGIHNKAKFTVPKGKASAYKKKLNSKTGVKRSMSIK